MNCQECMIHNSSEPESWVKISEGLIDDISGGTKWIQFKCSYCNSINNLKYKDIGINSSGWFYKNALPEILR